MVRRSDRHESASARAGPVFLLVLVVLGSGLYSAYYLNRIYREKELEIRRLNEVVQRLEAETRVAQVIVRDQGVNPATGDLETTIKFVEIGRDGEPHPPRYFTVKGDVIYFDALVVKFDHSYVEAGEALRGKSICLFRRVFGEFQSPDLGFSIDGGGDGKGVPDPYRIEEEPTAFELELWEKFWHYAENPEAARKKGVRVIQGEAVYTRFLRKNLYEITLDHDGGINIKVEPIPTIFLEENTR